MDRRKTGSVRMKGERNERERGRDGQEKETERGRECENERREK